MAEHIERIQAERLKLARAIEGSPNSPTEEALADAVVFALCQLEAMAHAAGDPKAFRIWQSWHAMTPPRPQAPPQPQWVKLSETMSGDSQRSSVRAKVLKLSELHGCVKAVYLRNEIAVFEKYIVDRTPLDATGVR